MQDFTIHQLGLYPVSQYYIKQLNMWSTFNDYLAQSDTRPQLSECLCLLIQNIVISPKPLYQIQDWLKSYSDGQGEFGYSANLFNDDRLGAALDQLYLSDRQSIMTTISSKAIEVHQLAIDKIHNDTTTVTLQGNYTNQAATGVQIKHGYNKDHRPDCKQIVFGLNTLADGQVPIALHLYDGNTSDDQTHRVNWNQLRSFLQTTDFCYIADSKAATKDNMQHIAEHQGTFISILPATRREVTAFKKQLREKSTPINWQHLAVYPNTRQVEQPTIYRCYEGATTTEDFRLLWIHSSTKAQQDKDRRTARLAKATDDLKEIASKLNKYKLKTKLQIEQAVAKKIKGCLNFFTIKIEEHKTLITKQIGRGKPSSTTKYKQVEQIHYTLNYSLQTDVIASYQRQDGIFPIVTNSDWEAEKVLKTYKEQPFLEKRFATLKSVLEVAPIFLKKPERIEAMLLLYFFALMVVALLERQIRTSMKEQKIESLPILPQKMKTKSPTLNNLRYLFRDTVMVAFQNPATYSIKYVNKGFEKIHRQILQLLHLPSQLYEIEDENWWKFRPQT